MAFAGILLLLWNQVTLPLLLQLQQLRYPSAPLKEPLDTARCSDIKGSPRLYARGMPIALGAPGRRELLREALEKELEAPPSKRRRLSLSQHEGLMGFFEGISKALMLKGVRWALGGPTLLGSLERHDLLPFEKGLVIVADDRDKQKMREACAYYNPFNEILKTRAYIPQTLLSWIAATKTKPKVRKP